MGVNQTAFIRAVREYRTSTGKTLEEVAVLLGISPHSLKSYVYARGRLPGLAVVTRAADLFGCSVSAFLDGAEDDLDSSMGKFLELLPNAKITDHQALKMLEMAQRITEAINKRPKKPSKR